jgi:hypothetical protein
MRLRPQLLKLTMLDEPIHPFYDCLPFLPEVAYTNGWIVVEDMVRAFHDVNICTHMVSSLEFCSCSIHKLNTTTWYIVQAP